MGQQLPINDLGPCHVYWNGIFVGETFGGVKFKVELATAGVNEDQHGELDVDAVTTGYKPIDVEVPLTRASLTQLETAIHHSTLVGNVLTLQNSCGQDLYSLSKELVLKPIVDGVATANTKWWTFFKAYPVIKGEIVYDNKGQRVFAIPFKTFPLAGTGSANYGKIWKIGV